MSELQIMMLRDIFCQAVEDGTYFTENHSEFTRTAMALYCEKYMDSHPPPESIMLKFVRLYDEFFHTHDPEGEELLGYHSDPDEY